MALAMAWSWPVHAAGQSVHTVRLEVSADAMIASWLNAPDPSGDQFLEIGTRPRGPVRVLVRFDLDSLPEDVQIESATLRLRRSYMNRPDDTPIPVAAYRLLRDWGEGRPGGATWQDAFDREQAWAVPGADGIPQDDNQQADRASQASDTADASSTRGGVFVGWDVTDDVRALVDGSSENHGWILVGPEQDEPIWVRFRSRENAYEQQRDDFNPELLIVYTQTAATQAAGPLRGTRGEFVPPLTNPSLLTNGRFEQGLTGWQVIQQAGGLGDAAVTTFQDVGPVLRLSNLTQRGAVQLVSDRIEVTPATLYEITGLYHTTTARYSTMVEFTLVEITDPSQPADRDIPAWQPSESGHTGYRSAYNSRPAEWRRKTRQFQVGDQTTHVRLVLTLSGAPATVYVDDLYFAEPQQRLRPWNWPAREELPPMDQTLDILAQRPDSTARVQQDNGLPRLIVDGQPRVPQVHMGDVFNSHRSRVQDFADHGVRLHIVSLFNDTQRHWQGHQQWDLDKIDDMIWSAVRRDPQGYFIIHLHLLPYPDWHKHYPDDAAQNIDGQPLVSRHDHHAPPDYWSRVYREQAYETLRTYVEHIRAQPYGKAVVGFFLAGGDDGQFYYQGVRGQRTIQDGHAPGSLPLFRDWLRKRYADEQALQQAWNDPQLTFDTAMPPIRNERYPGVFLDPVAHRPEHDFLIYLSDEVATMLTEMAQICRESMGKDLFVGAYYGRGASLAVYPLFAQTRRMLKPGTLDFLGAQPGYYGWREAGGEGHVNWVFDSVRTHNKVMMSELDFRSWVSAYRSLRHDHNVARFWHIDDLAGAMLRDAGKLLSVGGGVWWMEMSGGWFHEPSIMNLIGRLHEVSQQLHAKPDVSFSPAEIVFVMDEENILRTTEQINIWNGPNHHALNTQQRAIQRSGLRYDMYYLSDLIDRDMDDYKVYVFLNLYHASDEARSFIDRLKQNGRTLVWQYAPGYLAANGFSTQAMRELTGFGLEVEAARRNHTRAWLVNEDDSGSPYASALLAGIHGQMLGIGTEPLMERFHVNDPDAIALARYESDQQVAAAVKVFDDHVSVYMGHPSGFTPGLLHNLAGMAGVHRYLEPGNMFMHHRDDLVVIHGVEGGIQTLRLPYPARVVDLIEDKVLAEQADQIPLPIGVGDTLWLGIER